MKLAINNLKLDNFKGIKNLDIALKESATVKGPNGAGKSTIADSISFLITGNNNLGNIMNPVIKDENGAIVYGDNTATGIFAIDGKEVELSRVVITKNGKSKVTTAYGYFIDNVPVKAKEYDAYIIQNLLGNKIALKDYKLLSNPLAFTSLNWQDQRKILYDIFSSVNNADVLASDEKYKEIEKWFEIGDSKSLISTCNSVIKELNRQIIAKDAIIKDREGKEEVNEDIPYLMISKKKLEAEINLLRKSATGGDILKEIQQKRQELNEVISLKDSEIRSHKAAYEEAKLNSEHEKMRLENEIRRLEIRIQHEEERMRDLEFKDFKLWGKRDETDKKILEGGEITQEFRKRWTAMKKGEVDTNCPYCGKPYTEEELKTKKAEFELHREDSKKQLESEGESNKKLHEEYKNQIYILACSINETNIRIKELENKVKELEIVEEYKEIDTSSYDEEINKIQDELSQLNAPDAVETDTKEEELRNKIADIDSKINKVKEAERNKTELMKLKDELKELKKDKAKEEHRKVLAEQFSIDKARLLEKVVNDKFKNVTFKLFDVQKNGEVVECCVAMAIDDHGSLVELKPGIANTALLVNGGLEICKLLQSYYNLQVPIIIDNRESVSNIIDVDTQVINLVVDENAKGIEVL